ncbi:hypothetical protein DVA43_14390 [Leclercia sp. W6]|nr:hypothetical protein DVA43_14390 [Leclercia sp. W6]
MLPGGASLTRPTRARIVGPAGTAPLGIRPHNPAGDLCVTRLFYGEIKERNSREKVEIPNKCGHLQNRIAENNILPLPHVIS